MDLKCTTQINKKKLRHLSNNPTFPYSPCAKGSVVCAMEKEKQNIFCCMPFEVLYERQKKLDDVALYFFEIVRNLHYMKLSEISIYNEGF